MRILKSQDGLTVQADKQTDYTEVLEGDNVEKVIFMQKNNNNNQGERLPLELTLEIAKFGSLNLDRALMEYNKALESNSEAMIQFRLNHVLNSLPPSLWVMYYKHREV